MTGAHVVGVGDCCVSGDPDAVLVTYALGSCIAVVIHDPVSKVGGLLHYMLPESSLSTAFLFASNSATTAYPGQQRFCPRAFPWRC